MDDQSTTPGEPVALYRRFRPPTFASIVGQDTPVKVLTAAVASGRPSHAYLFSGPRGTGKTSAARVLAAALNCTDRVDVDPCGACNACRSIAANNAFDVIELDAASNNGVDRIREIITSVATTSYLSHRVVILDEVHMLSQAAANALLKTLEEPPPNVVFVLATTAPHSVLDTITSRTQHLRFRLVAPDAMTAHLADVSARASLDVSDDIIALAVRQGRGSVRDSLSALDVLAVGGADGEQHGAALADTLLEGDVAASIAAVATAVASGADPRTLAEEVLEELREVFLIQMGAPELVSTPPRAGRVEIAERLGPRRATSAMEHIGDALERMRAGHEPRISLEVAAARAARSVRAAPQPATSN